MKMEAQFQLTTNCRSVAEGGTGAHTKMDLLSKAYATASDDDNDDENVAGGGSERSNLLLPPPKRARPETRIPAANFRAGPETTVPAANSMHMAAFRVEPETIIPVANSLHMAASRARPETTISAANPTRMASFRPPAEAPIPGSYISKRQRAALAAADSKLSGPKPNPNFVASSPVIGSISDSDVPHGILATLRHHKGSVVSNPTPHSLSAALDGHAKSVIAVQWSRTHAHLLASAGMDHTVCIWNVWSRGQKRACIFDFHHAAVKDVKWSQHGLSVLSCGYDCTSRLIDVEKAMETQVFKEDQIVEVIKFCPNNYNLFLSGGSKGLLKLWDIRTGTVVHEYVRSLGPILDVEFTVDGKHLITSSDVSKSNLSENSIIVWDVSRQVPLSNQVYAEAYTCPSIRCHPFEPYFIAQSNGNYIAIFSTRPPFKLDKYKRYESHGVSGFPIKCNFSLDGRMVASGSNDGCIYFYNSKTSKLVSKVKAYEQACIDVVFHPTLPNVVASCSWNGEVSVFCKDRNNNWKASP